MIVYLSRQINDPLPADPTRPFDVRGAILSATGLVLLVMGILAADDNGWLMISLIVAGTLVLVWFFLSVRAKERAGEPLLPTSLFRNRTSNLGLITQNLQWLLLLGVSFVVSAYLQVVRGYNAIETGVIFTAATLGLLASSFGAERFAKARAANLIIAGFLVTVAGIAVLLFTVSGSPSAWAFAPGLLLSDSGWAECLTHRSTWCSPASAKSCRARYPAYPAACPTSALPSARPSPAPSSSPVSLRRLSARTGSH